MVATGGRHNQQRCRLAKRIHIFLLTFPLQGLKSGRYKVASFAKIFYTAYDGDDKFRVGFESRVTISLNIFFTTVSCSDSS
jgi:hypothetical protein